ADNAARVHAERADFCERSARLRILDGQLVGAGINDVKCRARRAGIWIAVGRADGVWIAWIQRRLLSDRAICGIDRKIHVRVADHAQTVRSGIEVETEVAAADAERAANLRGRASQRIDRQKPRRRAIDAESVKET